MRPSSMPWEVKNFLTDSARFLERIILASSSPTLSVWPESLSFHSGFFLRVLANSTSAGFDPDLMTSRLVSNSRLLKAVFKTSCSSFSMTGHPLFSFGPGVIGHSSSLSNRPSPSVSLYGHPLFSTGPATLGQSSALSSKPSPSVSG